MELAHELKQPRLWLGCLAQGEQLLATGLSAQEQRWAQALSPRRQKEYSCTRALVRQQLGRWFHCRPLAVPLQAPPSAYPHLADGLGTVSWSHSRGFLLLGWRVGPVGVDLESGDRCLQVRALLPRLCTPEEWEAWRQWPEPQVQQQLLQRWVQLEAFVKRQRSTLSAELGRWPGHGANESVALQVPMAGQRWWVGWSGGAIPVVETD